MGWKGTVRSVGSAIRRAEQESLRRQRELEKQRREYEKLATFERARLEVEEYENYVERLQTLHLDGATAVRWESIAEAEEPRAPTRMRRVEEAAVAALEGFRPSLLDRLLGREAKKRSMLEEKVSIAPAEDDLNYQRALRKFEERHQNWAESRQFAQRVLDLESEALLEAIKELDPFSEVAELGSTLQFNLEDGLPIQATLHVRGEEVVTKTAKKLLQTGRVSEKAQSKGQYYELYQDHVCSAVLRVARDLFAVLPIDVVLVTATDTLLNSGTGHLEEQAILSVAIPRDTLETLNLRLVDPSDSLRNFVHRMNFNETKGFAPIEPLDPDEIQLGGTR